MKHYHEDPDCLYQWSCPEGMECGCEMCPQCGGRDFVEDKS